MEITAGAIGENWVQQPTLSVSEAASVLGLSRNSVYAAIRSGEVPSIRVGRRFLVPTALLAEMLGLPSDRSPASSDPIEEPGSSQRVDQALPL